MNVERRIEKAEARLNLAREPVVCQIVRFGGGPLPADEQRGNVLVRHVRYEDIEKAQKAGEANH